MMGEGEAFGAHRGRQFVVGTDLGGTKLCTVMLEVGRAGAQPSGTVHRSWLEHQASGYADVLGVVATSLRECRERADDLGGRVVGLGLALAAWLSRDREVVLWAANLGARDERAQSDLARRLGLPVVVDNDGNATAWAEYRYGGLGESGSLVLFALGTGVGGGVVVDGRLLVGTSGMAGELGHMTVDPGGPMCVCGGRGCLELAASGVGIARAAGAPNGAEAVAAAKRGDPRSIAALARAGSAIGTAVTQLGPILDPGTVVLAGSLAHAAGPLLLPSIQATLQRERPLAAVLRPPQVRLGALGPEAGALGVAAMAHDKLFNPQKSQDRAEVAAGRFEEVK